MVRQPRDTLVRNLLREYWDPTVTFGVTPDISFGWYDDAKDQPQVCIRSSEEGPINGGQTGYSAINATGGSPNQSIDGVINTHVFVDFGHLNGASTDFPRVLCVGDETNRGINGEIRSIIRDNASSPEDPYTGNRPVNVISPGEAIEVPPEDPGTEEVHFRVSIGYGYETNDGRDDR